MEVVDVTARNLLLAGRSRKPGFGGIHGGERGLNSFDSTTGNLPVLFNTMINRLVPIPVELTRDGGP